MKLSDQRALGRGIAAARMLTGLDQADVATAAGVSAATVSNVERGNDARDETVSAIRKALNRKGATIAVDKRNGLIVVALRYEEPDEDDQ